MRPAEQMKKITPDEYLKGELTSEVKHELVEGEVYAMAGTSKNHERISGNFYAGFFNHLKGSTCEPFSSDMKVRVDDNFFYPDVSVICEDDSGHDYYTNSPVIIVEVLSPSTRKVDKTSKRDNYIRIPSLQEYVLIEQDFVDVEVMRRSSGWQPDHYFMGDEITFESIGLIVAVEDIYLRVKNQDVVDYLAKKEEEARLEAEQQNAKADSAV